jgi:electron transfer flavoprotein beta subunit
LKKDGCYDSFSVAQALAEEIKAQNCELVFMGKQSVDYDNCITGQLTAEILGYNCISVVVNFKLEGNKITAEREIEGGREVVETELPAIITTQKGLNEPKDMSDLTEIIRLTIPSAKQPGRIIGTDASAVSELVRLLREEAKVI